MKTLTLGKRGSLYVLDQIEDGTYMRVTRDFLHCLISAVIDKTVDFYNDYRNEYGESDYPLRYNERALSAVFMSSISTITNIYLSEIPVKRNTNNLPQDATGRRSSSSKGRMDCWARYRNVAFCIELKQGNLFAGKTPRRALKNSWKTLITQVEEAKRHAEKESGYNDTVGIGICVVPCFEYAKESDQLNSNASQIFCKLIDDICPKPHWASAWEPPGGRIAIATSDNNGQPQFEGVAAVSFLCHVAA